MKNVALIAVAKDEDAYIHEWIHHHLNMGFSPIYIGVNRTTDNTLEIINKISKTEKEVHAFCIDWIDKTCNNLNTRIQNIGYAYLSTKIDKNLVDYVGFLDIDEFWFNVDGKKIQYFIEEKRPFDIASFFWLCQLGEDAKFSPPFKDVYYDIGGPVKSIVSSSSLEKIKIFTAHVPSYKAKHYQDLIHIDQEGNDISSLNPDKFHNRQKPIFKTKNTTTCVLHRMMRSETEYLSLVLRGRPNGELIKSNGRHGFKKANIELPPIFGEAYYTSLNKFIVTHDLTEVIKSSRVEKLRYYKDKIQSMKSHQLVAEIANAIEALAGTKAMSTFVKAFVNKVEDVVALRDFAIGLEKKDLNLSTQLIQKAHELNPLDPFIKQKLNEYILQNIQI